jgi:hypothetical protein
MPLTERFPDIYDICVEQKITVADAAALNWNFYFRRWMAPDMALQIHGLLQIVAQTALSDESDKPFWKWTKSGKFTLGSVYKHF